MLIKKFGRILAEEFEDEKTNIIKIPHYTILKKLGARFHRDEIRCCYDFRFATFTIYSSSKSMTVRTRLKISVPFMVNDIGIRLFRGN